MEVKEIVKDKKIKNENTGTSVVIKSSLYQKSKIKTLKGPQPRC